jgi:hypothetical protein
MTFKPREYQKQTIISVIIFALLALLIWLFLHAFAKCFISNNDATYWGIAATIIFSLGQLYQTILQRRIEEIKHYDDLPLIINEQKDTIKLLNTFSPTSPSKNYYSDKSIYNAVKSLLNRAKKIQNQYNVPVKIKFLLCSPTFDYHGRFSNDFSTNVNELLRNIENNWGQEVFELLEEVCAKAGNEGLIYSLPNKNISGYNPLKGFIETLANYYSQNNEKYAEDVYERMLKKTEGCIKQLSIWKNDLNKNIKYYETTFISIPFQIFLLESEIVNEVIVSFAGKEIIEDHIKREPKGFHSVDYNVFKTFEEIFYSYVAEHRRIPLKPVHSLKIIKEHRAAHKISNYCNLGINFEIAKDVFSPKYANSSKFTSLAIISLLKNYNNFSKENISILDLGSGTGVQALVASKLCDDLGFQNVNIIAIDSCKNASNNMKVNFNGTKIKSFEHELITEFRDKEDNSFFISTNNSKCRTLIERSNIHRHKAHLVKEIKDQSNIIQLDENELNEISKFNLIVADLPFVDTLPNLGFEQAFFDFNHNSHWSLFNLVKQTEILKEDGILITTFSTLGGLEDLSRFDQMIEEGGLQPIKVLKYFEDEYFWLVYYLVKKKDTTSHALDTFWKKKCNVN